MRLTALMTNAQMKSSSSASMDLTEAGGSWEDTATGDANACVIAEYSTSEDCSNSQPSFYYHPQYTSCTSSVVGSGMNSNPSSQTAPLCHDNNSLGDCNNNELHDTPQLNGNSHLLGHELPNVELTCPYKTDPYSNFALDSKNGNIALASSSPPGEHSSTPTVGASSTKPLTCTHNNSNGVNKKHLKLEPIASFLPSNIDYSKHASSVAVGSSNAGTFSNAINVTSSMDLTNNLQYLKSFPGFDSPVPAATSSRQDNVNSPPQGIAECGNHDPIDVIA